MTPTSSRERVVFDVKPMLLESWAIYKANAGLYIPAFVFYAFIVSVGDWRLWVAGSILNGPLLMGLMKMALSGARNEPVSFGDMFIGFEFFLQSLIVGVLSHILVFMAPIGWVPALMFAPAFLFILETECGVRCALGRCWEMLQNNIREWILLCVILAGINVAGLFALGVGLVVTVPLSLIVVARAYDLEQAAAGCCAAHRPSRCGGREDTPVYPGGDVTDNV